MTHRLASLVLCPLAAAALLTACRPVESTRPSTPAERIARGRHLVDNVALCADCHTPRLPGGAFDRTRWLDGSPLGFKPLFEMPWSPVAPPIAGLHAYTDEQALALLTTGKRLGGGAPLPPMPEYRFTETEARDVIAYLRSLKPAQP